MVVLRRRSKFRSGGGTGSEMAVIGGREALPLVRQPAVYSTAIYMERAQRIVAAHAAAAAAAAAVTVTAEDELMSEQEDDVTVEAADAKRLNLDLYDHSYADEGEIL